MASVTLDFTQSVGETVQSLTWNVELEVNYPDALSQARAEIVHGLRDALAVIQAFETDPAEDTQ